MLADANGAGGTAVFIIFVLPAVGGLVYVKWKNGGYSRAPTSKAATMVVTVKSNLGHLDNKIQAEIGRMQQRGYTLSSIQKESSGWTVPTATLIFKR